MDIWTLLLITIFQFLNTTMAVWDPNSPLVLVQLPHQTKIFPFEVYWSDTYYCKLYYNSENRNSLKTYTYCPEYVDPNRFCNYADPIVTNQYEYGVRLRTQCIRPVEYDMEMITNLFGQHQSCNYGDRTGQWYKFVYWLCKKENDKRKEIIIYEACYQKNERQIILGSYKIQTPSLLGNQALKDERNYFFTFDTWPYYADFLDDFQLITLPLFQQTDQYVPRAVLPPEWLPFALQRKPLYHMTNVGAMDTYLIEGWEELMGNLGDRLSRMNEPVNVNAGLLDVLKDVGGNNKYLGQVNGEWEIPIANVWWVLIYNQNYSRGVAIMMHNERRYYVNGGSPNISYYDAQRCSLDVCSSANIGNSLPNYVQYPYNFIYCCEPIVITDKFDLGGSNRILIFPDA